MNAHLRAVRLIVRSAVLTAAACVALGAPAFAGPESPAGNPDMGATTEIVKRGAALKTSPSDAVALSTIIQKPSEYAGKTVRTEGLIQQVCRKKGCWMEITPEGEKRGVRVTFKDYGFFVPKDAAGAHVVAEGEVQIKKLPKEVADHYAEEGAKIERNPDGTANEVSLVALGVEVQRKAPAKK